jgi:hypothetical protein
MRATEISRRIARLYAALGSVVSQDLGDVTVEISGFDRNGIPQFSLSAQGEYSQAELEHLAASSVHAVANFFDHCVVICKTVGIPTTEADKVTSGSLSLRILRDLDNKDKHPASVNNSSGVFPELTDVKRMIRISGSKDSPGKLTFTFRSDSKEVSVLDRHLVDAVITGSVKNAKTGETLPPLHLLLADGISQWEEFLKHYGHHIQISLGFLSIAEKIWPPPK